MEIIERVKYEKMLCESGFSKIEFLEMKPIDIYHTDNWDHFTKDWDDKEKSRETTYMEFFFAAKEMIDFLRLYIETFENMLCYFSPVLKSSCNLKKSENSVVRELYYDIKQVLNSNKLRVDTAKVLLLNDKELLCLIERWSCAGFAGISNYSLFFPGEDIIITAHHHMNYLIYSYDKQKHVNLVKNILKKNEIILKNKIQLY